MEAGSELVECGVEEIADDVARKHQGVDARPDSGYQERALQVADGDRGEILALI